TAGEPGRGRATSAPAVRGATFVSASATRGAARGASHARLSRVATAGHAKRSAAVEVAARAGALGPQPLARLRGSPWQSLYLRPEPQGHGALRPTLANLSPVDSVRCSTW